MRAAFYCPGVRPHLLDHLAPLAELLRLPLYVDAEEMADFCKIFYPDCRIICIENAASFYRDFAEQYECLISTSNFPPQMQQIFEGCFGKRIRFVCCPHGHSEKRAPLAHYALHDLSLYYGAIHQKLLEDLGIWNQMRHKVRVGNFRLAYYLTHGKRWEPLLPSRSHRPLLLYAPTWRDPETGTSAVDRGLELLRQLPDSWDLWIKLHPLFEERDMGAALALQAIAKRAYILPPSLPIYPLLAQCDAFIGDASSINYDWLAFQKPLFFLSTPTKRMASAGFTLKEGPLFPQIERELENVPRGAQAALYGQAFGPLESLITIQNRLQNSLDILAEEERAHSLDSPHRAQASAPESAAGHDLSPQ